MSGANGIGKTTALVNTIANICYPTDNKYFQGKLFQEYPYDIKNIRIISGIDTINSTLIPELKYWWPKGEYVMDKKGRSYPYEITTSTGFRINILTYDQDPAAHESSNVSLIFADEPMPYSLYSANISRLRRGGSLIIFATLLEGSTWIVPEIIENQSGDTMYTFIEAEDACFDLDTEVMTPNGWIPIGDVKIGDSVYSVKQEGLILEEEKVTSTIYYKDKEVLELGRGITCTPDHEVLSLRETKEGKNYRDLKLKKIQARELYRGNRLISMISDDNLNNSSIEDEDWARFMGWYLSEGCCTGTDGGKMGDNYILITQQKEPNKSELRELLSRTKYNWREKKSGDFFTKNDSLYNYLFKFGNSHTKYIPTEFLVANKKIRGALFEALMKGDGSESKNSYRYSSTSKRLADDVQILAISLGYSTSISLWKGKKRFDKGMRKEYLHSDLYCVYISKHKRGVYVQKKPTIIGRTDVACISVPNQNIIIRNKNVKKPLVVGNCIEHGIRGHLEHKQILKMAEKYSPEERIARIFGKPMVYAGLVFKEFNQDVHVIDPFDINDEDYVVWHSLDTHLSTNEAGVWVAIGRDGNYYVVDELWGKWGDSELASRIKRKNSNYRIGKMLLEPAAFNEDRIKSKELGRTVSLAEDLKNKHNLNYVAASKERHLAVKKTKEAFRYQMVNGQFIKRPKLYIFNTCPNLIMEIKTWMYKPDSKKFLEYKEKYQKFVDKDDHLIEALGRIIVEDPVFEEPKKVMDQMVSDYDLSVY